jgi:hypothetical protein
MNSPIYRMVVVLCRVAPDLVSAFHCMYQAKDFAVCGNEMKMVPVSPIRKPIFVLSVRHGSVGKLPLVEPVPPLPWTLAPRCIFCDIAFGPAPGLRNSDAQQRSGYPLVMSK